MIDFGFNIKGSVIHFFFQYFTTFQFDFSNVFFQNLISLWSKCAIGKFHHIFSFEVVAANEIYVAMLESDLKGRIEFKTEFSDSHLIKMKIPLNFV